MNNKKPIEYILFCKRTESPKLEYIESLLLAAGIAYRRNGSSFHAPILEIDKSRESEAWNILEPIDNIPDDSPQFEPWNIPG